DPDQPVRQRALRRRDLRGARDAARGAPAAHGGDARGRGREQHLRLGGQRRDRHPPAGGLVPMPPPVDPETAWRLLGEGPAGLATDFDGTVSPIVSPPEAARPLPGVEASLNRLVDQLAVVALVSGRTVADLAL